MLPLLLLVYTSKANIPSVSRHFHQHGLSLDHPKLPSDQNRLKSEDYLNPHYPPSGGFGRASRIIPVGTIGHPTRMTANQYYIRVHRHSEDKQEGPSTYDGAPHFNTHTEPGPSISVKSDAPAWKRLISNTLLPHETISLIEEIFTNKEEVNTICDLLGDDAQTFINMIHEVRPVFLTSGNTT
jgi:hypothetical protein